MQFDLQLHLLHRKSPADASNCWKIDWMHGRPHLIVASNNLISSLSLSLLYNIKFLTQYPPPLLEWFMRHANQFKLLRTDENIADSIGNFPMAAPIAHPPTHSPTHPWPRHRIRAAFYVYMYSSAPVCLRVSSLSLQSARRFFLPEIKGGVCQPRARLSKCARAPALHYY